MIVEVTKQFIIDSLVKESGVMLKAGHWQVKVQENMCSQCAVGKVISAILDKPLPDDAFNTLITQTVLGTHEGSVSPDIEQEEVEELGLEVLFEETWADARRMVKRGEPMVGLSHAFEGFLEIEMRRIDDCHEVHDDWWNKVPAEVHNTAMEHVYRFIRLTFPDTLKIDINGYEAAKDIKIVEKTA